MEVAKNIWPDDYLDEITSVIDKVPQVVRLLQVMNTQFTINWSNGVTATGDSTFIFGGFLRWIVEQSGRKPTLEDFLRYDSDIDIMVEDFRGTKETGSCSTRLKSYFREISAAGCVIEYAGMEYGSSMLADVKIDINEGNLRYGNYIVWVPVAEGVGTSDINTNNSKNSGNNSKNSGNNSNVSPNNFTAISKGSGVKKGLSFADVAKGKAIAKDDNVDAKNDNVDVKDSAENKRWIKLDISFVKSSRKNFDFTANALTWPRKRAVDFSRCVQDIIARRIVPYISDIDIKKCYRMIKLYQRGYKFGVGNDSDALYLARLLNTTRAAPKQSRRMQIMDKELIGKAFVTGKSPSTKPEKNYILTTKYRPVDVGPDFVQSFPEYAQLLDCTGIYKSKVGSHDKEFENYLADSDDDFCEGKLGNTSEIVRAYKITNILGSRKSVCIMLHVSAGTPYICRGNVTMYERARVAAIYAYPNVDITELVCDHKITIVSSFDGTFKYVDNGVIKEEIIALDGGKPAQLSLKKYHGIYAYATMIEAWNQAGNEYIATLESLKDTK